jgi:hypothetical protein
MWLTFVSVEDVFLLTLPGFVPSTQCLLGWLQDFSCLFLEILGYFFFFKVSFITWHSLFTFSEWRVVLKVFKTFIKMEHSG